MADLRVRSAAEASCDGEETFGGVGGDGDSSPQKQWGRLGTLN